jgi:hypothetical protein
MEEEEEMAYANSQMPDKLSLRSIPQQPLITLMDILLQGKLGPNKAILNADTYALLCYDKSRLNLPRSDRCIYVLSRYLT